MPAVAEGSDNSSMSILAGMVGTTVSVFAFLIRSGQVKDQGWTMADWKIQKRDALVSATMMFILSAAVMITATATLHMQGQKMNHIKEMIPMLKPLFGPLAMFVFAIGIMAAGTSSHLPNMLVIPWLTDDINGKARDTRNPKKRFILLLLSQVGISVVMPMALLGLIYLSGWHIAQKEYRPKPLEWVLLALISCFSLFMSFQGIMGLIEDLIT